MNKNSKIYFVVIGIIILAVFILPKLGLFSIVPYTEANPGSATIRDYTCDELKQLDGITSFPFTCVPNNGCISAPAHTDLGFTNAVECVVKLETSTTYANSCRSTFYDGACNVTGCIPDNSCAVDKCDNGYCINNCGQQVRGTKDCSQPHSCTLSNGDILQVGQKECSGDVLNECKYASDGTTAIIVTTIGVGAEECNPEGNCYVPYTANGYDYCKDNFVQTCKNGAWINVRSCYPGTSCVEGFYITGSEICKCPTGQSWDGSKCISGGTGNLGYGNTLTFSEYITSPIQIIDKNALCQADSDCKPLKDYTVSCILDETSSKIIKEGASNKCDTYLGGIIGSALQFGSKVLTGKSLCDWAASAAIGTTELIGGDMGVCVGHSTTWYGGIYETILKSLYDLGIPGKWIIPILIIGGVLLVILLMNLIK